MGFPLIAFQNLRENLVQSIIFNVKRRLPFGSPPLLRIKAFGGGKHEHSR